MGCHGTDIFQCYEKQTLIGRCVALTMASCSIEPQHVGIYKMSSTHDLKSVTITIITFTETLSGNYSCFKTNDEYRKTICLTAEPPVLSSASSTGLVVREIVGIVLGAFAAIANSINYSSVF
ncbi:uncharacterized protein LOC127833285 [Dreissena polymorpha]|uniref:uncharacterized protein LOC127833285 n=1 Tax=Dreissena polymorpha TaxID=45954 RepID=UPI002263BF1A|nr:uncharacterized protein LOC127833285 [Dreissena polymorpha]